MQYEQQHSGDRDRAEQSVWSPIFEALIQGMTQAGQVGWPLAEVIGEQADALFPQPYDPVRDLPVSHLPAQAFADRPPLLALIQAPRQKALWQALGHGEVLPDSEIRQLHHVTSLFQAAAQTRQEKAAAQQFHSTALKALVANQLAQYPRTAAQQTMSYRGKTFPQNDLPDVLKADLYHLIETGTRLPEGALKSWSREQQTVSKPSPAVRDINSSQNNRLQKNQHAPVFSRIQQNINTLIQSVGADPVVSQETNRQKRQVLNQIAQEFFLNDIQTLRSPHVPWWQKAWIISQFIPEMAVTDIIASSIKKGRFIVKIKGKNPEVTLLLNQKGLTPKQIKKYKSFWKRSGTKESSHVTIYHSIDMKDGIVLEIIKPAHSVPGSFAKHKKLVDKEGITQKWHIETFDQNGHLIEVEEKLPLPHKQIWVRLEKTHD